MKKINNKLSVIIIENFISKESVDRLHSWIFNEKDKLTKWNNGYFIGGYRFFNPQDKFWEKDECNRSLNALENIPEDFFEIRKKISENFGFEKETVRKNATSLAGIITSGGFVSSHKDSGVFDCVHLRANIMIKCPKGGAHPIIENKTYELESGSLIIFSADLLEHSTTVHGSKIPRTLISYPFIMPNQYFN
jgi:hypothetical protein